MGIEAAEPRPAAWAPGGRGDLPDVNVWLARAIPEHPHHAAARRYWEDVSAPQMCFCRVTMLALVRLLCQPKLMGRGVLDLAGAFGIYRRFAALPEVGFAAEPAGCEAALANFLRGGLPARLWPDAYLAAFAQAAGLRLVSFDADFDRFAGLNWLRLGAPGA
ncbi:MAG: PIN domain-containing protein [Burkholderiales bacterium]|nr:PIN domain-containing protein [Burkholderiales bacterium]